jgi:tetratricopeptide (TPR) repeat protein
MAQDERDVMAIAGTLCARMMQTLEESRKYIQERSAEGALARGKVFSIATEYGEAAASYSEALAIDPNLAEAAFRLPLALLRAGQNERALSQAMSLAASHRDLVVPELMTDEKVSSMTILGETLLAHNRIDQAKDAYTAARKIAPEDSYAAGRLAQLSLATGGASEAIALAPHFAANPRACFRSLNTVLPLGNTAASLLPRLTAQSLIANLSACMPGRPILSGGEATVAPLVWGNTDWCPDIAADSQE